LLTTRERKQWHENAGDKYVGTSNFTIQINVPRALLEECRALNPPTNQESYRKRLDFVLPSIVLIVEWSASLCSHIYIPDEPKKNFFPGDRAGVYKKIKNLRSGTQAFHCHGHHQA
jgi:hypothetical protein